MTKVIIPEFLKVNSTLFYANYTIFCMNSSYSYMNCKFLKMKIIEIL